MRLQAIAIFLTLAGSLGVQLAPGSDAPTFRIRVERFQSSKACVTGKLFVDGNRIGYTVELPWKENQSFVSCIPVGSFPGILRYDKPDHWRIQLNDVPKRPGIQIHMGNHTSDSEGCILVGTQVDATGCSIPAGKSKPAYEALRARFYGARDPNLTPDKAIIVEVVSPIEGEWTSTDPQSRWNLKFEGTRLTWIERTETGNAIVVKQTVDPMSQSFRIERPNSDDILKLLSFNDEMRHEILNRNPSASFMDITVNGNKLTSKWNGLLATKKPNGHFRELKQPGTTPEKVFLLTRR
jgi:hypothetical protein